MGVAGRILPLIPRIERLRPAGTRKLLHEGRRWARVRSSPGLAGPVVPWGASTEPAAHGKIGIPVHRRYRISRAGEHVETAQSFPTEYYDPERDGVPPPVPSPEDRAAWPRPVDRAHYERPPRTHGGAPAPVVTLPEGVAGAHYRSS